MKTILKTATLLLTFLFLQSCSSDEDSENQLQQDNRVLRIEMESINDSLQKFDNLVVNLTVVTDSNNDVINPTPENYELLSESTIRSFTWVYDSLANSYEYSPNESINSPEFGIGITRNLDFTEKVDLYRINVYADDDLEFTHTVTMEENQFSLSKLCEVDFRNKK
ncbi:hypothetical protein [Psychroflexus tropicus]|uniref:hypothetical protein n=1 Tax=Psychroflexus tropicus TaxID=197345 RepID=UPI00037029C4|nr:hypothetical protein [Psychroflexus tropicus]